MKYNSSHSFSAVLLAGILSSFIALSAHANGLIGTSVTGSLTFNGGSENFFDPANLGVPAGYLNTAGTTVDISAPNTEFGANTGENLDSANFSSQLFVIEDVNSGEGAGTDSAFTMTFTDAAFEGQGLTLVQNNFSGTITDSLVGDVLTVNWTGGPITGGDDFTAAFKIATVASPEPSTWALLAVSLVGGAVVLRRRQQNVSL